MTNFAVFCNHVTIIPAIRAILDSPDMRLDGFIGPGHVSTVIGCRPYEFIARDYRCPIAVSGFEPVDILQSLVMVLRQLRERGGQGRKPIRPGRSLGRQSGGTARRWPRCLRCGRTSSGAGWGSFRSRPCAFATRFAAWDAEQDHADSRRLRGRSQGGPVRRSAQGRAQAAPVQAVRQGMHARTSDRRPDGFVRRSLRRAFQIRAELPSSRSFAG